jgi:hypothetical protein
MTTSLQQAQDDAYCAIIAVHSSDASAYERHLALEAIKARLEAYIKITVAETTMERLVPCGIKIKLE